MTQRYQIGLILLAGIIVGSLSTRVFLGSSHSESSTADEPQPLYWVAPMDANYRRDKPGKSPMGMDLIPVYEESASGQLGEGTVKIAPNVVHNLGVRTAPVEVRLPENLIRTVGYVQYDQDRLVHIHPRVNGWIEQLFVKSSGDPVEEGQPLYTLYSPELVNAQEEFLIALRRDNRTLIDAAKERLTALQLSDAFVEELIKTKKVTQNITFYAPKSGVLDALNTREGFYVEPGTTLMSVAQLEQIWVEAEVFERDAALVKAGLPVSMNLDYLPGKVWRGSVDYVYPALNPEARTLRVRLKFENRDQQLKPNMFASVEIRATSASETLMIPREALIQTGLQKRVVLALSDQEFKSVSVKTGQVDDHYVEILEGLFADDIVVTSAQFLIDSESTKTSDLARMPQYENYWQEREKYTATVRGVVNSVDASTRMINISRDAIPKWSRGPATMDFMLARNVFLSELRPQLEVEFTFEIRDDFVITSITPSPSAHSASKL